MSSTDLSSETRAGSRARAPEMVLAHFIVSDDVERSGASTPKYSAAGWPSPAPED